MKTLFAHAGSVISNLFYIVFGFKIHSTGNEIETHHSSMRGGDDFKHDANVD